MITIKSRNPAQDPGRPLDKDTLKEAGAEISINPRVDIFTGYSLPEATVSGIVVSADGLSATCPTSDDAAKFAEADCVIIYNTDPTIVKSPTNIDRNCIASVVGTTVYFTVPVKTITGTVVLAKELIFRVSNKNCYRVDEFGYGRAYEAGAITSDIEDNMGELFEYEWNTADYTLQIENYQGKYNDYLPGGSKEIYWGGMLVRVYLGTDEEAEKNILRWEGITHFNAGVSEENEVLTLNCYHISYVYNQEVAKNRFINPVDKDFENEAVPVIFGDWKTELLNVGSKGNSGSYPTIPAVLVGAAQTYRTAQAQIPYYDNGGAGTFTFLSKYINDQSHLGNGLKIRLQFYKYTKPNDWDKSGAIAYDSLTNTITIGMWQGKDSAGVAYNSTAFIKAQIQGNTSANALVQCSGESPLPMVKWNDRPGTTQNPDNEFQNFEVKEYVLAGGQTLQNFEYKISANPLDPVTTGFLAWYCKGGADDPNNWETAHSKMGGQTVTVEWDSQNGRVFIKDVPTLDIDGEAIDPLDYKLFVAVKGEIVKPTQLLEDDNVVLNLGHNFQHEIQNKSIAAKSTNTISSGNTSVKIVPVSDFEFGTGFDSDIEVTFEVREVKKDYYFAGVKYDSDRGSKIIYTFKYINAFHNIQRTNLNDTTDFCFEMEVNPKVLEASTVERSLLTLVGSRWMLEIGLKGNYPRVYFNNRSKKVIASNNQLQADNAYKLRVIKQSNVIKIFVKDLVLDTGWTEVSYSQQDNWTSLDNGDVNSCLVGYTNYGNIPGNLATLEIARAKIGVTRFANGSSTFAHDNFVDYTSPVSQADPVSIAKRLLEIGGATAELFDETWEQFAANQAVVNYDCRYYAAEENLKAVEEATKLLGQIGIVLTMKPKNGRLKFSLIWDSINHYQANNQLQEITDYDIEIDSVNVDREINQYFNSVFSEYNHMPATDEPGRTSLPFIEPAALRRDSGIQHWYRIEEKDRLSLPLPNLYKDDDVIKRLKEALAISTPNSEQINLTLTWRYLFLEIGQFVRLTYGRYQNVPCQVRSVKIDANGSKVSVKLMSLENIKFIDDLTGETYTPTNYNGIGGIDAIDEIIPLEDGGDVSSD